MYVPCSPSVSPDPFNDGVSVRDQWWRLRPHRAWMGMAVRQSSTN